jgi:hypothetical protein
MSDVTESAQEDPQGPPPAETENPELGHARPQHLATEADKAAEEAK